MLHGRLELHDVADVEKLARKVVDNWLRTHGAALQADDRNDFVAFLVAEIWRVSLIYEPRGTSFATFAYRHSQLRAVDWMRSRFGRSRWQFADGSYERDRTVPLSLDVAAADGSTLGESLAERPSDSTTDRPPAFDGLLEKRTHNRAQDLELINHLLARPTRGRAA